MGVCHPSSFLVEPVVHGTSFEGRHLKTPFSLVEHAGARCFPYYQEVMCHLDIVIFIMNW